MASFAEMSAMTVPSTRFFVRARDGMHCFRGPPTVTPDSGVITTPKDTDNALHGTKNMKYKPVFSTDGNLMAVVSDLANTNIAIYESNTGKLFATIPVTNPEYVEFSPRSTYLVTWSRPKKDETAPTLIVWDIATQANVASYHQKAQKQDALQWTEDESYCCQLVTNEVRIMRGTDLAGGAIAKVFHRGVTQYKVAPAAAVGCSIGVFVPEKGGNAASASLYVFPGEGEVQGPTSSRTMFSASEAKMLWNVQGSSLLVHTSSDVDHSGSSYYGATGLFMLGTAALNNVTEKVNQSKDGPIHDVQWSPSGDRFVVAAGNMPSRCTLYNAKAEMVYEFGEAHRNTILFSPHGRFLCLAGFGNLAGEMDFYDTAKNCKRIGSNTAHCSVAYGWSPDSRYFITAVLAPRMNVDNGFKIFKYNGVGPVVVQPFEQAFDCVFQPLSATRFPCRGQSPRREGDVKPIVVIAAAAPASKPAAYRPPGASAISGGLADMLRRESAPVGKVKAVPNSSMPAGGRPGSVGQGMRFAPRTIPGMAPAAAAKVKEDPALAEAKKEAKKKAEKEKKEAAAALKGKEEATAKEAARVAALPKPIDELSPEEKEKKVKNLRKKLKAIDELNAKAAAGTELNDDQKQKIAGVEDVMKDLAKLGVSS